MATSLTEKESQWMLEQGIKRLHEQHERRIARIKELEAKRAAPTPVQVKCDQVVSLKEQGKTHKEIGQSLGFSTAYSNHLYQRALRKRKYPDPEIVMALSGRTISALCNRGLVDPKNLDKADPHQIAKVGRRELLRIPDCGHGAIAEIKAWLATHGLQLQP